VFEPFFRIERHLPAPADPAPTYFMRASDRTWGWLYEPIARVFGRSRFDRYLLEYDDHRSGGFEPLRAVPDDRTVVLGLVTTKSPRLEPVAELRARVEEAARLVPLERLALSPQCGFASTMEGNRITPAEQEAKLRRVVETAREIWGGGSR